MTLGGKKLLSGFLMTLLITAPAAAQDRVIGLLSLPELFGPEVCAQSAPEDVAVYAVPNDTRPVAVISVDRNWSLAPHGGCEGLEVRIHRGAERAVLPTREYEYELPGAIVLEQRSGWFRVRLDTGTGWVKASLSDRFMSLAELFEEFVGLTEIKEPFSGRLVVAPGRAADVSSARVAPQQPVQVLEIRHVLGDAWVRVEVLRHSICTAPTNGPPEVIATGWLPLHTPGGEPTIWFSSRGC